jgi:hypothetical protein
VIGCPAVAAFTGNVVMGWYVLSEVSIQDANFFFIFFNQIATTDCHSL